MDNFRKVSQDSIVSLHLYGRHGWNVQSCYFTGLTNPSCTSSANECLPCRRDIEPTKIKESNLDIEDFAQHGKKKRPLVASPKKKFNPLTKLDKKTFSLIEFALALEEIVPNRILSAAVWSLKLSLFNKLL